jgi:hypothetical protein
MKMGRIENRVNEVRPPPERAADRIQAENSGTPGWSDPDG